MKRSLILVLILVTLLAVIWFTTRNCLTPPIDAQTPTQKEGNKSAPRHPGEKARLAGQPSSERLPLIQMKEVPYVLDYAALSRSLENPPFIFMGGAGTGRVVDREGKVLMESGTEMGIFGVAVGPNEKHVLVRGGDGKNVILTPATGEKLQLPVYPPGANMLCLGDWYWISPNTLLGQSGVQAFDKNGKPLMADNNVAETRLYVYDLTSKQLTEVAMPAKFTQALVSVMEVSPDGHVHIALDSPPL